MKNTEIQKFSCDLRKIQTRGRGDGSLDASDPTT